MTCAQIIEEKDEKILLEIVNYSVFYQKRKAYVSLRDGGQLTNHSKDPNLKFHQ
jgi:hypothetical protein